MSTIWIVLLAALWCVVLAAGLMSIGDDDATLDEADARRSLYGDRSGAIDVAPVSCPVRDVVPR